MNVYISTTANEVASEQPNKQHKQIKDANYRYYSDTSASQLLQNPILQYAKVRLTNGPFYESTLVFLSLYLKADTS